MAQNLMSDLLYSIFRCSYHIWLEQKEIRNRWGESISLLLKHKFFKPSVEFYWRNLRNRIYDPDYCPNAFEKVFILEYYQYQLVNID